MEINGAIHQRGVALFRVAVGIIFLWAGLDKLLAATRIRRERLPEVRDPGDAGLAVRVRRRPADGTVFNPTHDFWVGLAGNAAAS